MADINGIVQNVKTSMKQGERICRKFAPVAVAGEPEFSQAGRCPRILQILAVGLPVNHNALFACTGFSDAENHPNNPGAMVCHVNLGRAVDWTTY